MKTLLIDLNTKNLKLEGKETPQRILANWVSQLIVLAERDQNPRGVDGIKARFISKISDLFEKAVDESSGRIELEDDQYNFVRRCLNDAKVDPQYSTVVSRVLDCLERSEDLNKEKTVG